MTDKEDTDVWARRADTVQKNFRYKEIRIDEVCPEGSYVKYSYVANPLKTDTWENRDPNHQSGYVRIPQLTAGQYYLIETVNFGNERRTNWIWTEAIPVDRNQAMAVFRVREKQEPSRNAELSPELIKAILQLGEGAWYAYCEAKEIKKREPDFLEIIVYAHVTKTRIEGKAKARAKQLVTKWLSEISQEDKLKTFFGDDYE